MNGFALLVCNRQVGRYYSLPVICAFVYYTLKRSILYSLARTKAIQSGGWPSKRFDGVG